MNEISDNIFVNVQAEQAVIGAAMVDEDAAKHIALLEPALFRESRNAILHAVIRALHTTGQHVDLVTASAELDKSSDPAKPDTGYIVECIQTIPGPALYPEYIKILRQCHQRRVLYELGTELRKQISDGGNAPEEVREWASRQIKEACDSDGQKLIALSDALVATYTQIEEDHKLLEDGGEARIFSGIKTLDERLGGLKGGLYVAIGARPGVGKSILALTYCANAAMSGKRALLVSLEMDEIQITQRLLSGYSGVSLRAITGDPISDDELTQLGSTMLGISTAGLWYSTVANTVEKVREAAYQLYENGGLDLLAVDYLQLMDATYGKKNSRQEQISEISRGLRKLAAELKIPVIVLTQLNRESVRQYKNEDGKPVKREPTMSDARESGAIEQDANIFMLLHEPARDEMPSEHAKQIFDKVKDRGMKTLKIIVDKNRQGRQCRLDVAFDGDHMRFYPLNDKTEV